MRISERIGMIDRKGKGWKSGRVDDSAGLLNQYTESSVSWVRIPSFPAPFLFDREGYTYLTVWERMDRLEHRRKAGV